MKIVIPTMERADIQYTANQLLNAKVPDRIECFMVIPVTEYQEKAHQYKRWEDSGFKIIPCAEKGISRVRQFVLNKCKIPDNKLLMMDDDLRFFVRPDIYDVALFQATGEQVSEMVQWIEDNLEKFAHAGIPTRTQNFQLSSRLERTDSFEMKNVRLNHLHAFRTDIILGEELDFGAGLEINTMEDFHMVLSLLELGYPNIMSCRWAHDQISSNSRGGATSYRNLEYHKVCALNLKEKHPRSVTVVRKKTISSWGGTRENPVIRTDVRIQWQKSLGIRANESKL